MIKKIIAKYYITILFLILFLIGIISFFYFYNNPKEYKVNENTNTQKDIKIAEKTYKKKETKENIIVFNSRMHKNIINEYGKDYIIDYKYGIGYTTKAGSDILYLDPDKQKIREKNKNDFNIEINKICKGKINIKDFGIQDFKTINEKLNTYYNEDIFLLNEKIKSINKNISQYCNIYDKKSKTILSNILLFQQLGFTLEDYFKNTNDIIKTFNKENIILKVSKNNYDNLLKEWKHKGLQKIYLFYHNIEPIWNQINKSDYIFDNNNYKTTVSSGGGELYYKKDDKNIYLYIK